MDSARATHFGPGPRLAGLAALLRTASGAPVSVVADLADGLALAPGALTCLVLDLAAVPLEDLGLLRRLRARQPGLVVLWTGPAALAGALTAVADPGDVFRPWPLDVTLLPGLCTECPSAPELTLTELGALGAPAARDSAEHEAPASTAPSAHSGSALDPDLRHIEAILAGFERGGQVGAPVAPGPSSRAARHAAEVVPLAAAPRSPRTHDDEQDLHEESLADVHDPDSPEPGAAFVSDGPLLTHEELEAFLAPEPNAPLAAPTVALLDSEQCPSGAPGRAVHALPHWYRDQVADLADLVQRAELALHAAEAQPTRSSELAGHRSVALAAARLELGRLRQFARTLGCLAAPPAAGTTRLDLGVLVEETLASLAQRAPGGGTGAASGEPVESRPRFLFRSQAGVTVLADKGLLVAALDAVLGVAAAAGGAADVVRTEVLTTDAGVAEVRVDLPEGRLAGLEPARILEPYALRKRMPGIGAHALAAAGGILVGHGGDLVLERRSQGPAERGRLVFVLRLPAR